MNRKLWRVGLVTLFALLLSGGIVALARGSAPQDVVVPYPSQSPAAPAMVAGTMYTPTTVITVTSTSDPDSGGSNTCYTTPGVGQTAYPLTCTLRRAIVEASSMDPISRPVLIKFNIPVADSGYTTDPAAYPDGVWRIVLDSTPGWDLPVVKGGGVIIDGDTQVAVGGRSDGPKIIIEGQDLQIGNVLSGVDDGNLVRGLALQGGGIHLGSHKNIIEDNWVGLSIDGEEVYYVDGNPREANYATIKGDNIDNSVIQNNVVAPIWSIGVDIYGDSSLIVGNYIGTNASGTIPDVPENRKCHPNAVYDNWFSGGGMQIGGDGNQVGGPTSAERNIIAGMLPASSDPETTPSDAIEVNGQNHIIQNNYIGMDVNGKELWVCGRGITIDGEYNRFVDNVIVNTGLEAIGIYGGSTSLDAITLRGNVIKNAPTAIEFGTNVPSAWKTNFIPAQITGITNTVTGMTVGGTSATSDGGPCDGCIIELFLDDGDDQVETLQSLITTTADANGDWTVEVAHTRASTEGLRTTSTTASWGQVTNFAAGTTSKISDIYPGDVTPPPEPPDPIPGPPPTIPTPAPVPTPEPPAPPYGSVITVTSTSDPENHGSHTCYTTPGVGQTAYPLTCTLRRAIVEASSMDPISRPVLIKFNIPVADSGYTTDPAAYPDGVWRIVLDTAPTWDLPVVKGGGVIIDGDTQVAVGGRSDGPKIIIEGQDLQIGNNLTGVDDGNLVRGLALQGGGIYLGSHENIVEDNWVGLTTDGQGVYYVDDIADQSNYATIKGPNANGNLIQRNVVASANGVSIDTDGDGNVIIGNYVGTNADGTIPDVPEVVKCQPNAMPPGVTDNWFTGDGVFVGGSGNQVGGPTEEERNIIAGMLYASNNPENTPPKAMDISGDHNVVQNNYIGKDVNGKELWVCGQGIDMEGEFFWILDNTILNAGSYAFGIGGSPETLGAITLRGNILKNVSAGIDYGDLVPTDLVDFKPAKVISLDGETLRGTNGEGSPCPYCLVELFLDDADRNTEALESLGVITATSTGEFTMTVSAPFTSGQRIRTASTIRNYGVITNFEVGTTSDFSVAYVPPQTVDVIEPDGGSIVYTDTRGLVTDIEVPPGAVDSTTTFTHTAITAPTQEYGDLAFAGRAFNLDASASINGAITITLGYHDDDLAAAGINESSLLLHYWTGTEWDDVANTCAPASEYQRNVGANTLSVAVCHLTSFGLFGVAEAEDHYIYLPMVLRNS